MGEKLIIGPIDKGLRNDRTAFIIDNDSFPVLVNAYQWRGRIKRKRGTTKLSRLQRKLGTTDGSGNITVTISPTPIITGIVSFQIGTDVFYDPGTTANPGDQILLTNSSGVTHKLNRVSGVLTITGSKTNTDIIYFPSLPVMGFEDLFLNNVPYPGNIAFDTEYSYNVSTTSPFAITDVSFFKNPNSANAPYSTFPGYVAKSAPTFTGLFGTALNWNGQDYQQFWTTNYQNAFWATNGINVPFTINSLGMQYAPSSTITYVSNTATTIVLTITNCPLVVGDFVYLNEWTGTNSSTLNYQTGYVTACNPNTTPFATKTLTITFPNSNVGVGPYTPGIVQYLTNNSDFTKDCIRWFDGDPSSSANGQGWVNFSPPLINLVGNNLSIADLDPSRVWYLIGARLILPFKDRLVFFGPVVQNSSLGSQVYLEDTVIYSQNGTPYYTNSFQGSVLSPTSNVSVLVPNGQSAFPAAYFEDQTGFGGFLTAGVSQPITTASTNEDALIVGFQNSLQTRMVYTGNDIIPFSFYIINAELGSSSTFSIVNMDQGVLSRGPRGIIETSQTTCNRIDLEIPDQVFEVANTNNGAERFCSQRDFISEWVYFTYPTDNNDQQSYVYPSQTLQLNYRDNSWAIFNENYTTYGLFRKTTGDSWLDIKYTWNTWNTPWDSGSGNLLEPYVVGGNQQGYLMIRDPGITSEDYSLAIQNIVNNVVTSPNHCLNNGDFILINGVIGGISTSINGKVFRVFGASANSFSLSPGFSNPGSYLGGGQIKRYYVPNIITKQFPTSWEFSRKTRIGPQQYLLTTTQNGQITLNIYLSQDTDNPYNLPNNLIVPNPSPSNAIIYSNTLYTCPESTNLGLTPANVNLQMPTASTQQQIWHRMNTSLIGDTVQFGLTISDNLMSTLSITGNPVAITGVTTGNPTILNCIGNYGVGQMIRIDNVQGATWLNLNLSYNYYYVTASTPTTVSIDVNSNGFPAWTSGGTATPVNPIFQEAELEFHSAIFDIQPSSLLA